MFVKITVICIIAQVVQEYERAVIFRLGRLLPVGAKGPGEELDWIKLLIGKTLVLFGWYSVMRI